MLWRKIKQGRGGDARWRDYNFKSGTPLEKLAIEPPGSPWFLGMTDMTRDKSIVRLALMVSRQSMMECYDGHGHGHGQEAGGGESS